MILGQGGVAKLLELLIFLSVYLPSNQQQNFAFESYIQLTSFGTKFQPRNSIELLGIYSNIRSPLQCSMMCNQNRQCRTFDYDQSSLICRLFEGELSTGTIFYNTTSLTSRIGAIIYNTTIVPGLYSSYNQTCDQCSISGNRYLQCLNGTCRCPTHTYWNSQICSNQLYNGSNCLSSTLSCRQDLNLTCSNQTNSCIVSPTTSVCNISTFQQPPTLYTTGSGPQSIVSTDFNKDGYLDLAVTDYNGNTVSIFLGIGNGSFLSPPMSFSSSGTNPYWLVANDLNHDGNFDLAICNEGSGIVSVFLGFGNGSFQLPALTFSSGGTLPSSITDADLNNDNKTDLVVANTSSNNITVFLGLGNGTFELPGTSYAAGSLPSSITNGDFNNDSKIDLAVVSRSSDQLLIFFGFGDGTFQANATSYTTGSSPYAVRSADLNGDSKLDLVVANFASNSISIFIGTGTSISPMTAFSTYPTTGAGPIDIAIQDFNGDSVMDLAVSNQVGNCISVYLGNGNGTFEQSTNYSSMGPKLQSIIAQDFNKDGMYDLAVTNQNNNTLAILLGNCV